MAPNSPAGPAESAAARPVLGYLLSQYPAVSHTFLRAEIEGLRRLGFIIHTASINAPSDAGEAPGTSISAADPPTFYLKRMPKLRALLLCLRTAATQPALALRALRATRAPVAASPALAPFYLAEALLLTGWIARHRIPHLHIHFGGPVASVGRIAALAAGIPYSLTIHGPDEFFDESKFHLAAKLEDCSFVVCISDFCRSQLMRLLPPAQWSKLEVVRLGIDPAAFPARPRPSPALPTSGAPLRLLCVGRLVPAKAQLILLHALALLTARGIPVHVTLVGDGRSRAELQLYVQANSLSECVHFAGSLPHAAVLNLLCEADIFCLPSFAEGLPVALMEAMASGTPVVSTTIAGIPEMITDGVDGLLVPPSSAMALAETLARLALDPELRSRLANAARANVLTRYNLEHNLPLLAHVLQQRAFRQPAALPFDQQL